MTNVLPVVSEIFAMLGVVLLAWLMAAPLRRKCAAEQNASPTLGVSARLAFLYVAHPLLVLVLSELAVELPIHPAWSRWLGTRSGYVGAWVSFWSVILFIALIEAVLRIVYRMLRRPFPVPQLLRNIIWSFFSIRSRVWSHALPAGHQHCPVAGFDSPRHCGHRLRAPGRARQSAGWNVASYRAIGCAG